MAECIGLIGCDDCEFCVGAKLGVVIDDNEAPSWLTESNGVLSGLGVITSLFAIVELLRV